MEVVESCLSRVDAVNGLLNAVIWRNDEQAIERARAAADAVARGSALPLFHGVPVPIKDLTPVAGWPVTYGSWGAPPGLSAESELVIEALARAGFILTARTNTPEFGPITVAENSRYGVTLNPWDTRRTPGGSSGGAAVAVASGMFPVAHANDAGGSIRIPASCCGLVGLKVSRGRVPSLYTRWEGGAVEGVVTRDVADTAAVLDVISGPDRAQWYNAPPPRRPFLEEVGTDPGRLRVGVMEEVPFGLPVDTACTDATRTAASTLEQIGHHIEPVHLSVPDDFVPAFLNVVNASLADYDDIDWPRTEPHIRGNRTAAQTVDSLGYVGSVHRLQRLSRDIVARWGRDFDVLLTPTMTIEPPPAGDVLRSVHEAAGGPSLEVLQMAVLTSIFNVTGQPAISLPIHLTPTGIPIGVQLVAGPWEESSLLALSAQLEEAVEWTRRRPPSPATWAIQGDDEAQSRELRSGNRLWGRRSRLRTQPGD